MKPLGRRDAGFNVGEMRIVIVIIAILVVVVALLRYGLSFDALRVIVGAPLLLLGLSIVLSIFVGTYGFVTELRAGRRARRVMALVRAGSPEAESAAAALDRAWGVGALLAKNREELVSLLRSPLPVRNAAIRLLLISDHKDPVEADDALVAGAREWPPETLVQIWRLARTDAARLALAPVFLERVPADHRTRLLETLFGKFGSDVVPDPSEEWIGVLAPFAEEIRNTRGWAVDEAKVEAYLARFGPAKHSR